MHYTLDGLVVREMAWGENDKRIVLLTADRGRISVLAKGARSMRSKYTNTTCLFTYGNFEITERGGHAWLGGASVIESFWGIRDDIERLALASYVVDVAGELTGEEEPARDVLRLTLNTLYAIANDLKPREQIKATYEIRALAMSGYMPDLSGCGMCGKRVDDCLYLDVMNGMLECHDCMNSLGAKAHIAEDDARTNRILIPLGMSTIATARYIMDSPVEKVLSVLPKEGVLAELSRFGETYAVHHLEKRLPSLDFYYDVTRGASARQIFHSSEQ
jgi:DNA repair protein RecO (recombination protein O)